MYLKGLYLFFHSFQFFICILLSKMTKQMLKGIRVNSKEELSERIYRYFDEINADPIVYHWTYKMDEIDPDEAATIYTINNLIFDVLAWHIAPETDAGERWRVLRLFYYRK